MIIIAPDKFKGTLTAAEAADAIACGLRLAGVEDELRLCPMADGGDGTSDVLAGHVPEGVAIVESHMHIGPKSFGSAPPMQRSSHAFGAAIAAELARGKQVLAAIGGTACCDGGAGMLQALGLRAFDASGYEIRRALTPELLPKIASVDISTLASGCRIIALSDVHASLVPGGQSLSALDFARQKGFSEAELPLLADALRHWHAVTDNRISAIDGAGGGAGYALAAMMGAEMRRGADFVLGCLAPDFAAARLVITGEGCIDAQTGGGKVVATVVHHARYAGVPVLAIGGRVEGQHPFPTLAVESTGAAVPSSRKEATERLCRTVAGYFANRCTP